MQAVMRRWRDLPLGSKLAGLTSLLVLVVVLALTLLTVRRERVTFRQELEDQAFLLLETLPLTMRDQLYRLEIDELVDVANVVGGHEDVTRFVVYNREGAVLVDAAHAGPAFAQERDPLGESLVGTDPEVVRLVWQEGQLLAGRAIALGNQPIGAVVIGLSTASLDQKVAALTRQSVLLAVVTVTVAGGATFLLARQVTNPLAALMDVAGRMAGGDPSVRVELASRDEIGRLGAAFNQMARAIQRREAELRELAAGLERTVAARTAELREQNAALVRANEALTQARQQAEAANRAKSAVLSMVSHELRTPLTSILGFAKIIQRRLDQVTGEEVLEADDEATRALEQMRTNIDIILSEGERLTALINNVLDLAKIESGKLDWDMAPLAVADVLEQSLAATASLFDAKLLALEVDVADDLPPVVGDRDRLVQVMVNLISNAVKFTEEGGVTCRVRRSGDDGVLVSVSDTGVGIAPEDYDRVFERFVRLRGRSSAMPSGTGLGLPICKEIVEHHGGRIWLESTVGEGSTFFFTLPV